jgi:uncharacterized protein (TIGR03086 family)
MTDACEQYLAAWRVFVELAHGVPAGRWDAPTPCTDWTVRALIGHVLDGAHQVQAMTGGQDPVPPIQQPLELARLAGPDPAAAAHRAVADLQVALDGLPADTLLHTRAGELPLQQVLGMALIEPVGHGWDLATATGQQATFDADAVTALLAGVQQLGGQLAATGMYRPATIVDEQDPPLERLMAALGRTTG